jgi:hypothetical protein
VVGATAVIRQLRRGQSAAVSPWLVELLKRKPPKLATVALANKMARIAWKLMATAETYKSSSSSPMRSCETSGSGPQNPLDQYGYSRDQLDTRSLQTLSC